MQKEPKPYVTCACCGKGKVPLSNRLFNVLKVVRKKPATVGEIYAALCDEGEVVGRTAINNRLVALQHHGLITAKKIHTDGPAPNQRLLAWVYTAAKVE